MPRYVAFLRAVNVGGRIVKMTQLKSIFEELGLADVETFIASGNVIFSTKSASVPTVVRKIETGLRSELGYEVPVFLRTDAQIADIAQRKYSAFDEAAVSSAHSLNIGMLHEPLSQTVLQAMKAFDTDTESFRVSGSEIHMLLHSPVTTSKFSLVKFEKAIGAQTSFRNMNTIERLAKKYPASL
ncbi:MAG: DUF1697 domain-containing protein [Gemmatimonas sp.]